MTLCRPSLSFSHFLSPLLPYFFFPIFSGPFSPRRRFFTLPRHWWCLRKNGLKKKKINWNLEKNWRQTFPSVLIQSKPSKYTARRIILERFFARIILSDLSIYNPSFFFFFFFLGKSRQNVLIKGHQVLLEMNLNRKGKKEGYQ